MKNQHPGNIAVSPQLRAKLGRNPWKQAGVALATAACILLSRYAQATDDTLPANYLGDELSTLGVTSAVSSSTTTSLNLQNALRAIIAQTTNSSFNTADSNPGLFITYILGQRDGSVVGGANDAKTIAPFLVTAAIQGLAQSVNAGSADPNLNPVTTAHITAIVQAAAAAVAQQVANGATGTTDALKLSSATTAMQTAISAIVKNGVSTALPSGVTAPALAASLLTAVANTSYNVATATTTHFTSLPPDVLGKVAGDLVGKVAVTQQAAAGSSVATAYLASAGFASAASDAARNAILLPLVKNLPNTAVASAFAQVSTAGYTDLAGSMKALFKALPVTNIVPEIAGITKNLVAADASIYATLLNSLTPIKTGTVTNITQAARAPILAGLAAGAAAANPAGVVDYINQALNVETTGTSKTAADFASAANKQDLIVAVVGQVANSNPVYITNALTTLSSITTGTTATQSISLPTARVTLAQKIVNAAIVNTTDGVNRTAAVQNAVVGVESLASIGADQTAQRANLAIGLLGATVLSTLDPLYAATLRNIASTAIQNWHADSALMSPTAFAHAVSGTSTVPVAAKAQFAAGIVSTDTSLAATIVTDIAASQTTLANKAALANAILSVSGVDVGAVIAPIVDQVDANHTANVAMTLGILGPDSDRKTLANTLAKSNPLLSSTIATILATRASSTAGFDPIVDGLKARYDIASGVITANPLNGDAVTAAVNALFPSSLSIDKQVTFTQKVLAASPTAAVQAAKTIGGLVQASGTTLSAFTSGTAFGGTTTLYTNTQIANIAAGFAFASGHATASSIAPIVLPAVLRSASVNGGQIVAAIITTLNIPGQAADLSGSAAAIVTGTSGVGLPSTLGTIGNKVGLAIPTDAADMAAVTTTLAARLGDLAAVTKVSGTVTNIVRGVPVKVITTPLSVTLQADTRIKTLGTFAGNILNGLTDPTVIANVITNTTTGTIDNVDLANLISASGSGAGIFPNLQTQNLANYGAKVTAAITTGVATPFATAFRTSQNSARGFVTGSTVNATLVGNFAGTIINGASTKAKEFAQGVGAYVSSSNPANLLSIAAPLASRIGINTFRANATAGLALAAINLGGSGIGGNIGDISAAVVGVVNGLNQNNSIVADPAIQAIATAVAGVAPLYAWNVAQSVAPLLQSNSDRAAFAKAMVTAISLKLTGPTANERVGLLVAACATGISDQSVLATIIAKAIQGKNAAAYDIFGSVAVAAGLNATQATALLTAVTTELQGLYLFGTPAAVTGAISQAATDSTTGLVHFFKPSTGDLTGQETQVTNS